MPQESGGATARQHAYARDHGLAHLMANGQARTKLAPRSQAVREANLGLAETGTLLEGSHWDSTFGRLQGSRAVAAQWVRLSLLWGAWGPCSELGPSHRTASRRQGRHGRSRSRTIFNQRCDGDADAQIRLAQASASSQSLVSTLATAAADDEMQGRSPNEAIAESAPQTITGMGSGVAQHASHATTTAAVCSDNSAWALVDVHQQQHGVCTAELQAPWAWMLGDLKLRADLRGPPNAPSPPRKTSEMW
ncbi:hypothetical protein Purlil1_972 [Purpureocillium lilacinum]|uniref:Uncharacterized protein n=1 Tax=Purpureocillium lilacinum TaxID=33203 RepID=A0ABR0CDS7_PURLI|nr:hypothetical protein Purlil1_972 [Purpureocillium lilacinum]